MYRKNVAGQGFGFELKTIADGLAKPAAGITMLRSIDGAAHASATGTTVDLGVGHYWFNMSQADTNGNTVSFFWSAVSDAAAQGEKTLLFSALDRTVAGFGLLLGTTNFTGVFPTNFPGMSIEAVTGRVKFQAVTPINVALPNLTFPLTIGGIPTAGATITTKQRRIDSGSFANGALSVVTDLGDGIYSIDLAASDLNGKVITLKIKATGYDTQIITFITTP